MYRSLALNTCILWAEFIQSTTSRYFVITTMVISTSWPDRQLLAQQKQQKIAKKRRLLAIMTVLVGATFALEASSRHFDKTPKNTSILTGRRWLDELLAGHPIRFYDNLGMNKRFRACNEWRTLESWIRLPPFILLLEQCVNQYSVGTVILWPSSCKLLLDRRLVRICFGDWSQILLVRVITSLSRRHWAEEQR